MSVRLRDKENGVVSRLGCVEDADRPLRRGSMTTRLGRVSSAERERSRQCHSSGEPVMRGPVLHQRDRVTACEASSAVKASAATEIPPEAWCRCAALAASTR